VLVSLVNPYVATFLEEKTTVYEVTETKCREAFQSIAEKQTENVQQEFMQKMGVPENFSNTLRIGDEFTESAVAPLAESTAHLIVNGLAFVITFVLLSILLRIAVGLLDGLFRLPVLSMVNRLAGGAIGAVQGLVILWVFFLIVFLIWNTEIGAQALAMIQENLVINWLYNCNPFVNILLK
jgi:ABC-type amino acid transport system permease subunit